MKKQSDEPLRRFHRRTVHAPFRAAVICGRHLPGNVFVDEVTPAWRDGASWAPSRTIEVCGSYLGMMIVWRAGEARERSGMREAIDRVESSSRNFRVHDNLTIARFPGVESVQLGTTQAGSKGANKQQQLFFLPRVFHQSRIFK